MPPILETRLRAKDGRQHSSRIVRCTRSTAPLVDGTAARGCNVWRAPRWLTAAPNSAPSGPRYPLSVRILLEAPAVRSAGRPRPASRGALSIRAADGLSGVVASSAQTIRAREVDGRVLPDPPGGAKPPHVDAVEPDELPPMSRPTAYPKDLGSRGDLGDHLGCHDVGDRVVGRERSCFVVDCAPSGRGCIRATPTRRIGCRRQSRPIQRRPVRGQARVSARAGPELALARRRERRPSWSVCLAWVRWSPSGLGWSLVRELGADLSEPPRSLGASTSASGLACGPRLGSGVDPTRAQARAGPGTALRGSSRTGCR